MIRQGTTAMVHCRMRPGDDSILKRFRVTLEKIYGARLERVVLHGSRARGDARLDSDYDLAVFLHGLFVLVV